MSIVNYKEVRNKWMKNFFLFHSISKVVDNFGTDSTELVMFENLLFDFCKNPNSSNEYILMGGLDYNQYTERFYKCSIKLMNTINISKTTNYQLIYKEGSLIVKLK
jgi:hypothetical protein